VLNELYALGKTLGEIGIKSHSWHKQYKSLPKSKSFRILIGSGDSLIHSIEPFDEGKSSILRKWEPNNGDSFPCFNFQPITFESENDFMKALGKGLLSFEHVMERRINFDKEDLNKKRKKIKDFEEKLNRILDLPQRLSAILGEPPPEFSSFGLLVERLKNVDGEKFLNEIVRYICENQDKLEDLSHIMFTGKNVQVILDIYDYDFENGYPVSHEKIVNWINERLNEHSVPKETAQGKDAFGDTSAGSNSKLPDVKLPILGKVILRSMVEEARCQFRYRRADFESFCIGSENHSKLKSALEWLSQEDFKRKTWDGVAEKEVLFGYPSKLPEDNNLPSLIRLLKSSNEDSFNKEMFKNIAEEVIQSLQGISNSPSEIEVRLFALKKMDKNSSRTKVVYNVSFSAENLKHLADEWQYACSNLPELSIKEWGEKKGETVILKDYVPKPLDISSALNRCWTHLGVQSSKIEEFDITIGVDLLLDRLDKLSLSNILRTVVKNGSSLIIATAQSIRKNEVFTITKSPARDKILLPVILGLLLYKFDHKKEDYMKTSKAYLLGNLLALSDSLHLLYCKYVRTSEENRKSNNFLIPPQLMGNALMNTALESPERAFCIYGQRIMPYKAWAQTNRTEVAKLTNWMNNKLGEISFDLASILSTEGFGTRLSDNEKAMLLLGYLAGVRKDEKVDSKTDDKNTEGGKSDD